MTAVVTYYYLSAVIDDLGRNQQLYTKLNNVNKMISSSYIGTIDPLDGYDAIVDRGPSRDT